MTRGGLSSFPAGRGPAGTGSDRALCLTWKYQLRGCVTEGRVSVLVKRLIVCSCDLILLYSCVVLVVLWVKTLFKWLMRNMEPFRWFLCGSLLMSCFACPQASPVSSLTNGHGPSLRSDASMCHSQKQMNNL